MNSRWPDFFIVGAPRCGTSSMYAALRQHPEVFMPALKEPAFFCSDLDRGANIGGMTFIRSETDYLALFRRATPAQLVGEACVLNLYSRVAAGRMRRARPDARILVHLRDPIEQMYSWHAFLLTLGIEPMADFEAAIDDEHERPSIEQASPDVRAVHPIARYRSFASFTEQIERYHDAFGRQQVHVIMLEDMARDPRRVVADVTAFLGLSGPVRADLSVEWPNRGFRSRRLFELMRSPAVVRTAKRLVPPAAHSMARRASALLYGLNLRARQREPMPLPLRNRLRAEMRPEVERLSRLLGRDLVTEWWQPT